MILDRVKIVLFDFDDTLCVHNKEKMTAKHVFSNKNIYEVMSDLIQGEVWWADSVAPDFMKEFVTYCDNLGIRLGLLSATGVAFESNAKIDWVEEHYGVNMLNCCCPTDEDKLRMLNTITKACNLDSSEVLLVDDKAHITYQCGAECYQVANPIDVYLYMQAERDKSFQEDNINERESQISSQ